MPRKRLEPALPPGSSTTDTPATRYVLLMLAKWLPELQPDKNACVHPDRVLAKCTPCLRILEDMQRYIDTNALALIEPRVRAYRYNTDALLRRARVRASLPPRVRTPNPAARSHRVMLAFTPEQVAGLNALAAANGRTLSTYLYSMLVDTLLTPPAE